MKRRMIGAGIAGIALLVAGCGAGQITQTDQQVGMVDGAAAEADTIFIRNAEIAYPDHVQPAAYLEGDDADVVLSMINTGQNPDELVSVTSPDADDASISGRTTLPADTTVAVGPEAPQEGSHQLHAEITLNGLKREVRPGQDVTATLTFREAGTVEVRMPVKTPDEPRHNEPVPEPEKHLTPH